ncbi:MAG: hypothetical protein ABSG84_15540 [Acidobacteriaceae bacterium]|jgi:hypothetical protein
MSSRIRLTLLIPLAAVLGCALPAANSNPLPTEPAPGNWLVSRYGSGALPQVSGFAGALQFSSGSVSGILTPEAPPNVTGLVFPTCTLFAPTAVTGTIDAGNNLTLSLPIGGGTATISATIGSNPETAVTGSFQIVGGTCAMSAVSMTIAEYAPVTGTYTGSFTNMQDGTASPVTAVLTQSTIANSNGVFPLTGTVTLTGECSTSFVISDSYSYVEGDVVFAMSGAPAPAYLSLWGDNDSTASTISSAALEQANQKGCIEYEGTLTRQ